MVLTPDKAISYTGAILPGSHRLLLLIIDTNPPEEKWNNTIFPLDLLHLPVYNEGVLIGHPTGGTTMADKDFDAWLEQQYEDAECECTQAEWDEAQRLAREQGEVN
jgi:hypothetical protein